MRLSLFTAALLLSACNAQETKPAPDATATETPASATPDGAGETASVDPDIAKGEIPARFHGVWDAVTGTCERASEFRVAIGARRIEFYESVGNVAGMGSEGDDAIADLMMEGEGETWLEPTRLSLETTPEGERLRLSDALNRESPDDLPYKRCRA